MLGLFYKAHSRHQESRMSKPADIEQDRVNRVYHELVALKQRCAQRGKQGKLRAHYLPDRVIEHSVSVLVSTLHNKIQSAKIQGASCDGGFAPSARFAKTFERTYERKVAFYSNLMRRADDMFAFAYAATRKMSSSERHIIFFALGLSDAGLKGIQFDLRDFLCMKRALVHNLNQGTGRTGYAQVGSTLPAFFTSSHFHDLMGGTHGRGFYRTLLAIRKKMFETAQMGLQQLCARSIKSNLTYNGFGFGGGGLKRTYSLFSVLYQFDRNYLTYFTGLRNYCYHMMRTVEQEKRNAGLVEGAPVRDPVIPAVSKVPSQWLSFKEAKAFSNLCEENPALRLASAQVDVQADPHLFQVWRHAGVFRSLSFLEDILNRDKFRQAFDGNKFRDVAENGAEFKRECGHGIEDLEDMRALRVATLLAQRIAVAHRRAMRTPYASRWDAGLVSAGQGSVHTYLVGIEKLLHALKDAIKLREAEQEPRVLYDFATGFYQVHQS